MYLVLVKKMDKKILPENKQSWYIQVVAFSCTHMHKNVIHQMAPCGFYLIQIWHYYMKSLRQGLYKYFPKMNKLMILNS